MSQTTRSNDGTERTPGDVAVVKPYYLTEEAYKMGRNRFSESDPLDEENIDQLEFLTRFKESAEWIESLAPEIRAMAGFATSSTGEYQKERQVAAIQSGCEEDKPAEADLVSSQEVFELLVDAFEQGALDVVAGRDFDLESVPDNV